MVFLQEMISAWHSTQHLKLGLFSDAEAEACPLAPDEISKKWMKPFKPENIEAHDLWIRFIQERIEIAKYCSQEQIFMFSHMLQRTLDIGNVTFLSKLFRILSPGGASFFEIDHIKNVRLQKMFQFENWEKIN